MPAKENNLSRHKRRKEFEARSAELQIKNEEQNQEAMQVQEEDPNESFVEDIQIENRANAANGDKEQFVPFETFRKMKEERNGLKEEVARLTHKRHRAD